MRSGMAKGERKGSFFFFGLRFLKLALRPIQDRLGGPTDVKLEAIGVKDGGAFSVSVNARNLILTQ